MFINIKYYHQIKHFFLCLFTNRVSGVSDHYANDDYHALHITKVIIENLNNSNKQDLKSNIDVPEPPLYSQEELYGIVGENLKKNYDVREVFLFIGIILNVFYNHIIS